MDVTGKTIAVTGKFKDIQRKEIELALAQRGAKVAKSVTGKTEILIAGERAGSKLAKANQMGIRVIHEPELLDILKQEATVEVEPPKAKTVALPAQWADKTLPQFEGRVVYLTGKVHAFKRAQLKALLEASGATVVSNPSAKTTDVISGDKWSRKLRDAIAHGATVYTEGELLLSLEGRKDFPQPSDIPHGANLNALPVLEEGQTHFNTPGGGDGELTLRWKKVAFKPHRRFLELHGFEYDGEHQWLGQFHYNGQPLKPTPLFWDIYGAESWHRALFWECGTDFDDQSHVFDGEHGFNCTPLDLRRKRLHVNWTSRTQGGNSFWMLEHRGENHWYGSVCHDEPNLWIMVDLERGLYAVNAFTHPYIIRPDNPYGR